MIFSVQPCTASKSCRERLRYAHLNCYAVQNPPSIYQCVFCVDNRHPWPVPRPANTLRPSQIISPQKFSGKSLNIEILRISQSSPLHNCEAECGLNDVAEIPVNDNFSQSQTSTISIRGMAGHDCGLTLAHHKSPRLCIIVYKTEPEY